MTLSSDLFYKQTKKAILALLAHTKGASGKSENDAEGLTQCDAEEILLLLGYNTMPEKKSLKPMRISIPKPFLDASNKNLSVCVFTKDPQRKYKDLINSLKIPSIHKIQGISKLRTKFKPFEAKRNLCGSFDLFLADKGILPLLPKVLGKTFFSRKKQPLPVDIDTLSTKTLAKELTEAIQSTYYYFTGGANSTVVVGNSQQDGDDITENIITVIKSVSQKLTGGISVIKSIHLKTSSSIALPIFVQKPKSTQESE